MCLCWNQASYVDLPPTMARSMGMLSSEGIGTGMTPY
jgi:hypothetical protein